MVILLLILATKVGYDYYRVFAWRQTNATVISTRHACEYSTSSGRSGRSYKYPLCDDGEEIARLTGKGYEPEGRRRLRIQAVYESEPGKNTAIALDAPLEEAGAIKPGSTIEIRVSSDSAELTVMPDGSWALLLAGGVALFGAHLYIVRSK